jgi:tetratricopeptide (TPR) repeat protein
VTRRATPPSNFRTRSASPLAYARGSAAVSGLLRKLALAATLIAAAACSRSPEARESSFLKSAQKHLQARDIPRAILDFKNAAIAMPRDPEPHYQMGLAYSSAGDLQDSLREFDKAAEIDPRHASALLKMAEILIAAKNIESVKQGEDKARRVLQFSPENADAWQILAAGELREGHQQSAVNDLQTALQKSPGHLKSAVMLAAIKAKNKDLPGAEQVLKQAAQAKPESAEHALALGRFYAQTNRIDDAREQFQQALTLDPKNGPALVVMADLAYRGGNAGQAAQYLQRASALPDRAYWPLHAAFLLENGKADAAVAEFEQLYKRADGDHDLRTRLIAAYLRTGRNAQAEKMLAAALKKDPNDSAARLQRGEFYLAARNYTEAANDVNAVLKGHPESVSESSEAHLLMSRIYEAQNDSSGRQRELSEALSANPGLLSARVDLAHALTLANSPKAAVDLLDAAPEDQRANPALLVERNTALYTLGDYASMRKGVDQGLDAAPEDPDLLLQDGLLRLRQHDIAAGRASLELALRLRPEEWRALEALANSYVAEKNLAQATALVRDYTSRVRNSIAARQFLAGWLSRTGDFIGARGAYQQALDMAPPGPQATAADRQLAELYLRYSYVDSARSRLLSLLKGQPGDISVVLDLALTEYRAGHWGDAIGYYEKALQINPNSLAALNNLAFLLADTSKDPDRALQLAQRAKLLAPSDPTVNDTLGWAYYVRGDYVLAVQSMTLNKVLTPKWKCHLAMAYLKMGKREEAGALLQAALKQDPSLPEARTVRALLDGK